jgi:hypothetical protein
MGPAPICFQNFNENSLKGDLSNDTTPTPTHFSLVNTFKKTREFEYPTTAFRNNTYMGGRYNMNVCHTTHGGKMKGTW